jgi:hypothetical protein
LGLASLREQSKEEEIYMKRAQRRSVQQWAQIIEEQEGSGLDAQGFCKSHTIALASFYQWRRRLRNEAKEAQGCVNKTEPFIEVGQIGAAAMTSESGTGPLMVTLDFGEGLKVTVQRS